MRLLIAMTFVTAAWVCFIGATFNPLALLATVFFCGMASALLWLVPEDFAS